MLHTSELGDGLPVPTGFLSCVRCSTQFVTLRTNAVGGITGAVWYFLYPIRFHVFGNVMDEGHCCLLGRSVNV